MYLCLLSCMFSWTSIFFWQIWTYDISPNTSPHHIPTIHLLNLLNSPLFHTPTPATSLLPILPTVSTTLRQTTSLALMLRYNCLSNDHYPGISSSPSELQFSRSDVVGFLGSIIGSLGSTATIPVSRSESLVVIPHPTSKILSALTHGSHGFILVSHAWPQNASY